MHKANLGDLTCKDKWIILGISLRVIDINQFVCIMDNNTINAVMPITLKQVRLMWTIIPNIV